MAYRALNATACFFIESPNAETVNANNADAAPIDAAFLKRFQSFLERQFSELASKTGDSFGEAPPKMPSPDIPYHYIYFNPETLSVGTSLSSSSTIAANESSTSNNAPQLPPAVIE